MTVGSGERRERGYDHTEVEPRWQRAWDDQEVFHIEDDAEDPEYVLAMFPYPSGEMHMGHVRNYTITDAFARYKRMQGEEVLHPMGWDSFGLPAENAANERDVDPRGWTMDCIENIKDQMNLMGLGFDWDREVTTCQPDYFRWNQWFFLQFYEAGLVERAETELNWCPSCETVLADENVNTEGGVEICWRCDTPIEHRDLEQWFFTITDYADELYESLDDMEGWPDNVREMQRNWIGKQEGDAVAFDLTTGDSVEIFTTRLDTIYGATFFALAPGHPVARDLAEENDEVAEYVHEAEHADEDLPQTSGVFTGEYATNPATGEEIPVYVADYVLEDIGTGALYAVPAHDDRDHAFAEEHDIAIEQVVEPDADVDPEDVDVEEAAYTADGVLDLSGVEGSSGEHGESDGVRVDPGEYDGLTSAEAREAFVDVFDGEHRTEHSLRDWCISRQRYWGTPIPFVECPDCGYVPVPEDDLPVELPEFVQTTGNPLDAAEEWKETTCPDCGGPAERETDTMDTFVDSSWYFLRYVSPDLETAPFDTGRATDWMPVDQYVGGIEHATMHLIYSRFFTKVLDDLDLLDGVREPFENLLTQGMVRKGGKAMSSSSGNVVSPRPFVEEYGADTGRLFMMEAAQPEKDFDWTEEGARSAHNFLQSVYTLAAAFADGDVETRESDTPGESASEREPIDEYVAREVEATAAAATAEFEAFRFNHGLQAVRELVSLLRRYRDETTPEAGVFEDGVVTVAKVVAPVAPHVAEEVWETLGRDGLIAEADWPAADPPEGYDVERRLVENTRADVRDIVDTVGIEDPETVTLVVSPAWKHRAHELARDSDADNLIGDLMSHDEIRERGDAAADFAQDLQAEREALSEALAPDAERAALERAAWLVEREFDADVVVRAADGADPDLAADARPGRPAIRIE